MDTVSTPSRSLFNELGSSAAPYVLDVRRPAAFEADALMIAGALRPEGDLAAFAAQLPGDRPIVVYCVHGHEVSQQAAADLAAAGRRSSYLEGGIAAWRAAGLPTMRRRADWRVPGGSRWITRERPKIDRIACPWLIRRFIDPLAAFDYVPTPQVMAQAAATGAVPYDIPGATVSHRGERCSFDALLEDFELREAGLLAASLGLSQRHSRDHEMLESAMPLYDGLYAWCRQEAGGTSERHSWNPGG